MYLFQTMNTSSSQRPLRFLFIALIALQGVFLSEVYFDWQFGNAIEAHRGGWLLAQFIGTTVLFIDMVVRFDELHPKRRGGHVLGVAFCAMGWCFQFFVHYLDSALLN